MTDDAELLRRYAEERSEEAFAELVRRHLGLVYGAALRQLHGSTHRAEDVAQSVFIDLARKAAPLSRRPEIVGWLYTSTHHAAVMLKRSEARREEREKEAQAMQEIDREAVVDWNRIRPVLDEAILGLAEADRLAVLLRFFQDRKLAEIGRRIGLSEDAARMRIDRALEKIRVRLERHGISSTSAALAAALGTQAGMAAPASLAAKVTGAALASAATAAAGTGALVQIWSIMSTSKTLAGISGVVALLALGTATFELRQVRALAANVATLENQRSALVAERDALRGQTAELSRTLEDSRKNAGAAKAPPETNPNPGTVAARSAPFNLPDALGRSPEYAVIMAKLNAAKLGSTYGAFYRQMLLTPAQIEEFERLMGATLARGYDVWSATWSMGVQPGDPTYAAVMQKHTADTTAKITEWLQSNLGPAGLAKLQDYNRLKPVAEVVRSLAAESYDTASPLTAAQGDQLAQVLANGSVAYQRGGTVNLAEIDWNAAAAQAATFLAPEQMKSFTSIRDQRLLTQQMAQFQQKLQKDAAQGGK